MFPISPHDEQDFIPQEFPLDENLFSYIDALSSRSSGTILFRTGVGRLFRDLLLHWPVLDSWENEALEFCSRITDSVFPLAGSLYAQAVEMTVIISNHPINRPLRIEALSTYLVFDAEKRVERRFLLSPKSYGTCDAQLDIAKGVAVMCRPLNYLYHTILDDRQFKKYPSIGIFELAQRLINELYEKPPFISRELEIIAKLRMSLEELPNRIAQGAAELFATGHTNEQNIPPAIVAILAASSLSALPPAVREIESYIMSHAMDKSISSDTRMELRKVAQALRDAYPQALLVEAERIETHPAAYNPIIVTQATEPNKELEVRTQTNAVQPIPAEPLPPEGRRDDVEPNLKQTPIPPAIRQTHAEQPQASNHVRIADQPHIRATDVAVSTMVLQSGKQRSTHPASPIASPTLYPDVPQDRPARMSSNAEGAAHVNPKIPSPRSAEPPSVAAQAEVRAEAAKTHAEINYPFHNYSAEVAYNRSRSGLLQRLDYKPMPKSPSQESTGRLNKMQRSAPDIAMQRRGLPPKVRLWAGILPPAPIMPPYGGFSQTGK